MLLQSYSWVKHENRLTTLNVDEKLIREIERVEAEAKRKMPNPFTFSLNYDSEDKTPVGKSKKQCSGDVGRTATITPMSNVSSKEDECTREDEELIAVTEEAEEKMRSGGIHSVGAGSSGVETDDEDEYAVVDIGDVYVRPCGYEKEFWEPLINEDYGGSNAVEIMCSSNDAFDHKVSINGCVRKKGHYGRRVDDGSEKNCKAEWTKASGSGSMDEERKQTRDGVSMGSSGYVSVDGEETMTESKETRKLEEVDDEEFDIPPLYGDMLHENIQIPDLDVDADGEEVYVGKVYESKQDCQIGLAIYAVKEQFHFKQTRTKLHSFVLNCVDRQCDWRVTAHENKTNGYYVIRKASLKYTCCCDTRNGYKAKVTSRVIASVFKAKYGDPTNGPRPMELQQLVLEI